MDSYKKMTVPITTAHTQDAKMLGRQLRDVGQAAQLMVELAQRRDRDTPKPIVPLAGFRAKLWRLHACPWCSFQAEIIQWVKWHFCPACGRAVTPQQTPQAK